MKESNKPLHKQQKLECYEKEAEILYGCSIN
jgi:hypothetical protein